MWKIFLTHSFIAAQSDDRLWKQKAINQHNEVIYETAFTQQLPFKFSIFSRNYFGISLISVGMSVGVNYNVSSDIEFSIMWWIWLRGRLFPGLSLLHRAFCQEWGNIFGRFILSQTCQDSNWVELLFRAPGGESSNRKWRQTGKFFFSCLTHVLLIPFNLKSRLSSLPAWWHRRRMEKVIKRISNPVPTILKSLSSVLSA